MRCLLLNACVAMLFDIEQHIEDVIEHAQIVWAQCGQAASMANFSLALVFFSSSVMLFDPWLLWMMSGRAGGHGFRASRLPLETAHAASSSASASSSALHQIRRTSIGPQWRRSQTHHIKSMALLSTF